MNKLKISKADVVRLCVSDGQSLEKVSRVAGVSVSMISKIVRSCGYSLAGRQIVLEFDVNKDYSFVSGSPMGCNCVRCQKARETGRQCK